MSGPGPTQGGRGGLSPELISQRGFMVARRGYDQDEVRAFLDQVAAEVRALHARADEATAAAAEAVRTAVPPPPAVGETVVERPPLDLDEVVTLVGEETAAILRSARAAAVQLRQRAEQEAERVLEESRLEAARLRREADAVLAGASAEAERAGASIVASASAEAEQIVGRARSEADTLRAQAEQDRRLTVDGAQAMREKILGDLSRRRRVATVQIEQLRAGRERLLDSYAMVRRTLEEVHDELQRADAEARSAADDAGRRVEAELGAVEPPVPADLPVPDLVGAPAPDVTPAAPAGDPAAAEDGSEAAPGLAVPWSDSHTAASGPAASGPAASGPTASVVGDAGGGTESDSVGRGRPRPDAGGSRIDLRSRPDAPEGSGGTVATVTTAEPYEGVRILRSGSGSTTPRPRADLGRTGPPTLRAVAGARVAAGGAQQVRIVEEPDVAASPQAGPDEHVGAIPTSAEDLFGRMRAERAASVAAAKELLADTAASGRPHETGGPAPGGQPGEVEAPEVEDHRRTSSPRHADDGLAAPRSAADESALERRDRLVADVEAALTKRLKRVLQDEQNTLLDRLRNARSTPDVTALLGAAGDHAERIAAAATPLLVEAVAAGGAFVDAAVRGAPEVAAAAATGLAEALTNGLRRRLGEVLSATAGDEPAAVVEAIGAVYREYKTQRVEPAVTAAATSSFAAGTLAAVPAGTILRWVVEDPAGPCADCDDNALAGAQPAGEAFPTGQLHPPAHAGCRCLLAVGD